MTRVNLACCDHHRGLNCHAERVSRSPERSEGEASLMLIEHAAIIIVGAFQYLTHEGDFATQNGYFLLQTL